jgi:branched-chain amino acid transport system substrate-binding protein
MNHAKRAGIAIFAIAAMTATACQARTITVEKPVEVTRIVEVTAAAPAAAPAATTAAPAPAPAAAESDEIVVGVALPFTGALGEFGKGFKDGIDLAVEQMNAEMAKTGKKTRFKVVSQDTTGTPDGAAKAVQTVVQTSGAKVVVGPLTTGEVLGAKQFADSNKVVIIAPASSGVAGGVPNDFIFRVMNPPDSFSAQAFQGIATTRGYKNVVIMHVDDPFGNGMLTGFSDRFKAAGGGEVASVKFQADAPDLSSEVTKASGEVARLAASGKTAFFCVCFLGDAQKVVKLAAVDANLGTVDWMGIENLFNKKLLENKDDAAFLSKVNFTVASAASTANPNTKAFNDAYKAKFGKDAGAFTNYAYDAANIAMLSIVMAGNDGEAVQKVLPFVADHYIGTQVQTYLDENGDQAIAVLDIYKLKADGSDYDKIGVYDGSSGATTFTSK